MTFEQKDIGGRPFEKPEVRELPLSLPKIIEPPIIQQEVQHVRKTSEAPKKAAEKVRAKSNKATVARVQKKS